MIYNCYNRHKINREEAELLAKKLLLMRVMHAGKSKSKGYFFIHKQHSKLTSRISYSCRVELQT